MGMTNGCLLPLTERGRWCLLILFYGDGQAQVTGYLAYLKEPDGTPKLGSMLLHTTAFRETDLSAKALIKAGTCQPFATLRAMRRAGGKRTTVATAVIRQSQMPSVPGITAG